MFPLYVSGCFGMVHPAHGRRGALICGALADEALNAYRPLVFLAEQLAAAGIPTLRLAYHGVGDSAGGDGEADLFQRWLDGIAAGAAWLCREYDLHAVTLIGHRVGASLAARAACDCAAADSLVLLNPIAGRHFVHELTLAARISQRVWQTSHRVDDGTWFEAHGLRVDRATRQRLEQLDIRRLPDAPAAQALVLDQDMRPATQAAVAALQRLGTATTAEACDDLAALQRDSHQAAVPQAAFARVAAWMAALPQPAAREPAPLPTTAPFRGLASPSLDLGALRETPIAFGPGDGLFGILSLPARLAPEAPALLLVNTSANPRWGNARIAVELARTLAADGIATLRMDACGMGDSAPHTGVVGQPYAELVTQDVLHAATELARRTQRSVVVLGICSGAYHALQAACRHPAIAGLVLLNLQRFVWRAGDPPDAVRRSDLRPTRFYLRNIFGLQAWRRLLRADFDVVNLVRVLMLRLVRRAIAGLDPLLAPAFRGATRVGRVRRTMTMLHARGVRVLYILGRNDPGVEELAEYFGSDGRRLRQHDTVTMRWLDDADHTLGAMAVRVALMRQVRDWCRQEWGTAQAAQRRLGDEPAEAMAEQASAMDQRPPAADERASLTHVSFRVATGHGSRPAIG